MMSLPALAQKFSVGAELGAISSSQNDADFTSFQNRRNTYLAGVKLNYGYNSRLSFSTGLQYLRLGYRNTTCYIFEEGVKNELTGKIDYLVIPLLANIHVLQSRRLVFTFGLLAGVNIKAVQDYPDPIGGCQIYYTKDLLPTTHWYTLKGQLGLGYKLWDREQFSCIASMVWVQGLSDNFQNSFDFPTPSSWTTRYGAAAFTVAWHYKL